MVDIASTEFSLSLSIYGEVIQTFIGQNVVSVQNCIIGCIHANAINVILVGMQLHVSQVLSHSPRIIKVMGKAVADHTSLTGVEIA